MGAIPCPQNGDTGIKAVITVNDLIVVRKGGSDGGGGTWIHLKLRMVI